MIINLENHTVLMHEDDYSKIMQYKLERDTLIDDLSWYKAKVSRLERHNKDLRLQSDTYFEQWQQHKALNNEFSQHIGKKPSGSTYKYFRAKLDGIGIKEGE